MSIKLHCISWFLNDSVPHFSFNDPAPTQIYTLSLHDALPISQDLDLLVAHRAVVEGGGRLHAHEREELQHVVRSEEHTSELQSLTNLVCRLLLEKKKIITSLSDMIYTYIDF